MKNQFLILLALFALTACDSTPDWLGGDEEAPPLPGERVSILELQQQLQPDSDALNAIGFIAPQAWNNDFWPQAGGYPNHAMQNLALNSGRLELVWQADIGQGSVDSLPLTAQPIVVNQKIFTLDTRSQLSAFSTKDGQEIWRADVRDLEEDDPVISGGIAFANGRIYVTSGYDELLAVNPDNGQIIWRVSLNAPSRAAPTILDGRIFVSLINNALVALDEQTGQLIWEYSGIGEGTGLLGAASPAANSDIVVPAFSSGELYALQVENGSVAWSDNLSPVMQLGGLRAVSDIRGMPVLDKGLVFAISFGGKMAAIDERTGRRVWSRDIKGSETPWVAGNHVFVLSSDNELVALARDNGIIRWVAQLPKFEDPEDRQGLIKWKGPILAGERLLVSGSRGRIAELDPNDGEPIRQWSAQGSPAVPPIVADSTLYILAENGRLLAYR